MHEKVVSKKKMPSLEKEEMRKVWAEFKGLEVKESMLDKTLIKVANGNGIGIMDRFRQESKQPLEDLGVKVVMFSGVPTQYLTNLINYFREGIAK